MSIPKMGFRNIFRQRRRSFLTALTMVGAFVLTSMSFCLNFGAYNDIIETFTRKSYGQVKVHESTYLEQQSLYKTVHNWETLAVRLDSFPSILGVAPRLYSGTLFSVGSKTTMGKMIGIDPTRETHTFAFNKRISSGILCRSSHNETVLGKGLANSLKAKVGDTLFVLTQAADGSMANDLYRISGIVSMGNEQEDNSTAYFPLDRLQELLVLENQVHELAIVSSKKGNSIQLAHQISSVLPENIKAFPWQEFLVSFYRAMKSDQEGGYVSLVIIMAIAAGGILNTVLMAVLERRREYGLLKALGTTPGQIFSLVYFEMIVLSALSIGLGILIALPLNIYFTVVGITLSQPMSYGGMDFTVMHGEITSGTFLIPAVLVLLSTLIVTLYPAILASKTTPADSMRKN